MKSIQSNYEAKIVEVTANLEALIVAGADSKAIKKAKQIVWNWTHGAWTNAIQERAYVLQGFGFRVVLLMNSENQKQVEKMHKDGMTVDAALRQLLAEEHKYN